MTTIDCRTARVALLALLTFAAAGPIRAQDTEDGPRERLGWAFGAERPRVGITLDPTQSPEDDALGARVQDLLEGGPADAAGMRAGDVVTAFDAHSLLQSLGAERERRFDLDHSLPVQRLLALARELEPGDEVELTYLREGEERTATLEARALGRWGARAPRLPDLAELGRRLRLRRSDGGPGAAPRVWSFEGPDGMARIGRGVHGRLHPCPEPARQDGELHVRIFAGGCPGGLRLVELNPGLGEYFGTEEGVLVADVHADSGLGLEPGDVLLRIGARTVDSAERARRILESYEPDESMTLHIVRDGRTLDVQGRLSP